MTSVQERLQINRTPLDKWSTREQLCLASAVSCSGDQNWMTVSRTLKLLCGNSKDPLQSRPPDWFSQKNCAVQYGHLLEDVETPKRKKRNSESSTSSSSPAPIEPPTEAVLRRLTEERMQDIKQEIINEQEDYAKIFSEIKAIQCGQVADDELLKMWSDLEKEQDMVRIEEMKMENQMRERELRKHELQRNWRAGTTIPSSTSTTSSSSLKTSTDTTAVDMDVEEIIGTGRPVVSITLASTTQTPSGTSPLLSSLLKSPTAVAPVTNIGVSSARSTAPTITTLLTGGSIPNTNQPAIIPSRDDAKQLLTRPLSGPPLDSISSPISVQQQLLSPSQSAPTLSMLLEKNKNTPANSSDLKSGETNANVVKNAETTAAGNDSNNESIPMDIEEDLPPPASNNENDTGLQVGDADETDPNEEQQLLEVFKNIGNIEELDIDVSAVIDEEVDFLKDVDDEDTPTDENLAIQQKLEQAETLLPPSKESIKAEEEDRPGQAQSESATAEKNPSNDEFISSDESIDNIPLATVASSSKDIGNDSSNESFLKEEESAIPKEETKQEKSENDPSSVAIKQEQLDEQEKNAEIINDNVEEKLKLEDKKPLEDVFVMPTSVEEIKTEGQSNAETSENSEAGNDYQDQSDVKSEVEDSIDTAHLSEQSENNETQLSNQSHSDTQADHSIESTILPILQPPPLISIAADTDENSSSTDISVQTRKDEKRSTSSTRTHHQRKSPHEVKTDDEMPNPSTQMPVPSTCGGTLTPRPTALRKLRDRDRSESPMIDDDATMHSDHSTTTNQRSRRRYSSTPVIDSIPNSPASSERDESRELRTPKKSLLSIFNVIQSSKYAASILRVFNTEIVSFDKFCYKQMDFVTIRRNIESGAIRNIYELQRDILLLCQNALMVTKTNSSISRAISAFQQECQNIREFMPNGCDPHAHAAKNDRDMRDPKSSGSTSSSTGGGGGSASKGRSGSRKSSRFS